jgi:hypothetical protein
MNCAHLGNTVSAPPPSTPTPKIALSFLKTCPFFLMVNVKTILEQWRNYSKRGKTKVLEAKSVKLPIFPPQISHELARGET